MENIDITVSGDSGVDHSELCQKHLSDLEKNGIYVPIIRLENPIRMNLAADTEGVPNYIVVNRNVIINKTIYTRELSPYYTKLNFVSI